jgi:hypothetical protein
MPPDSSTRLRPLDPKGNPPQAGSLPVKTSTFSFITSTFTVKSGWDI